MFIVEVYAAVRHFVFIEGHSRREAARVCDLARDIQNRMRRARDQRLTITAFPGRVEAYNNACERDLRPAVIQRKNTDGYRAMWSAKGEAAVLTVVATARITSDAGTFRTVLGTIGA